VEAVVHQALGDVLFIHRPRAVLERPEVEDHLMGATRPFDALHIAVAVVTSSAVPAPGSARPDVWQLWSRNRQDQPQGVFSHATALTLPELSDAMPAKLDMTVPPGF